MVIVNLGDEEGKSIHKTDFQGSRYRAIADYERENPEGIRENNEALFSVDHYGRTVGNNEQKGNLSRLTCNKGTMINKEKREAEDTNWNTCNHLPTEKETIKGTRPSNEGRTRSSSMLLKFNGLNKVTSGTLIHAISMQHKHYGESPNLEINKEGLIKVPSLTLTQRTKIPLKPPDPPSIMLQETYPSQEHRNRMEELNEDLVS